MELSKAWRAWEIADSAEGVRTSVARQAMIDVSVARVAADKAWAVYCAAKADAARVAEEDPPGCAYCGKAWPCRDWDCAGSREDQ